MLEGERVGSGSSLLRVLSEEDAFVFLTPLEPAIEEAGLSTN